MCCDTQGQWWGDVFNGEGSMIHTAGVSYEGMWVNGRPEGIKKCTSSLVPTVGKVCVRAKWLIRPQLIPVSVA